MDERTEKSLGMLKSYVLNDAHKTREQLTEETENRITSRLDSERARLSEKYTQLAKYELDAVKRENKAMLQAAEQEARRELIECRSKITDEIFDEVKEKISTFKQTDEYKVWLDKTIQKAVEDCGGKAELFLSGDDMQKIQLSNIAQTDILGGVIARNKERGITADYSVDTLLAEAREEFVKSSGLTIEI